MDEIKQLRKDVGYLTGRVKTLSELVEELSKEIRGLKVIDSKKMTEKPKFKPTNNQKRARSIKKAKELVNKYKGNNDRTVRVDDFYIAYRTEFVVNKEKRTVIALIKSILTGKVYYKGIAKCLPEDVWNEDIGKAIALCRGLKLTDVESEFIKVVNPDKVVVDMLIKSKHNKSSIWKVTSFNGKYGDLIVSSSTNKSIIGNTVNKEKLAGTDWLIICDDTDVNY